jgi:hypothetical protein
MTHEDAGHYAAKHPETTELNEKVAEQVKAKTVDGKITCGDAHKIANDLKISSAEVGVTIDLLEARIAKCRLGLFGHSPGKAIVKPAEQVHSEMQQAIEKALVNGRLPCSAAWEISAELGKGKKEVAAVCEKLRIKICDCQIGSFK